MRANMQSSVKKTILEKFSIVTTAGITEVKKLGRFWVDFKNLSL